MPSPKYFVQQKELLTEFYKKHAPEKLNDVDKNILKYSDGSSGGFPKMWAALEKKYKAKAPAGAVASPKDDKKKKKGGDAEEQQEKDKKKKSKKKQQEEEDGQATEFYSGKTISQEREKLRFFFDRHDPSRVGDIEKHLKRYGGKSGGIDEMWKILHKKFKSNEEVEKQAMAIASASGSLQHPTMLAGTAEDESGSQPNQEQEQQQQQQQQQYDPRALMVSEEERQRKLLELYFLENEPQDIGDVDRLLERYADDRNGGYGGMWRELQMRYNVSAAPSGPGSREQGRPPLHPGGQSAAEGGAYFSEYAQAVAAAGEGSAEATSSNNAGHQRQSGIGQLRYSPEERQLWFDRLKKFYNYYVPEKTDADIDFALDKYNPPDGYEKMWKALLKKYGAEPAAPITGLVRRYMPEHRLEIEDAKSRSPHRSSVSASPDRDGSLDTSSPQRQQHSSPNDDGALSPLSDLTTDSILRENSESSPAAILGLPTETAVVLSALIRFQGCTIQLYEKATHEQQLNFRRAVETDVSRNLGLERTKVYVTKVSPGIVVEMELHLTYDQMRRSVGEELVTKVLLGSFTVPTIRDSYKRDIGGNPMQLHTEGAAIYGGACTPQFSQQDSTGDTVFVSSVIDQEERNSGEEQSRVMMSNKRLAAAADLNASRAAQPQAKVISTRNIAESEALPYPKPPYATYEPILGNPEFEQQNSSSSAATAQRAISPFRMWSGGLAQNGVYPSQQQQARGGSRSPNIRNSAPAGLSPRSGERKSVSLSRTAAPVAGGTTRRPNMSTTTVMSAGSPDFLDKLWKEENAAMKSLEPQYGIITSDSPYIPSQNVNDAVWRESMKPQYLNPTPSTDLAALPTRTAPPTFTRFPAMLAEEKPAPQYQSFKKNHESIQNQHVSELMHAIKSPHEYIATVQNRPYSNQQHQQQQHQTFSSHNASSSRIQPPGMQQHSSMLLGDERSSSNLGVVSPSRFGSHVSSAAALSTDYPQRFVTAPSENIQYRQEQAKKKVNLSSTSPYLLGPSLQYTSSARRVQQQQPGTTQSSMLEPTNNARSSSSASSVTAAQMGGGNRRDGKEQAPFNANCLLEIVEALNCE